jgi:steroid delta-isomerase-like uncharacterized protein
MKHVLASLLLTLFLISCGDNDAADGDANDSTAHGAAADDGKNIDSARIVYEKVYAAMSAGGNLDDLDNYVAADAVDHQAMPGQAQGLAGLKTWVGEMRKAFPDIKLTLDRIIAHGDEMAALFTMTGTQEAPLMGMGSKGKTLNIQGVDWIRVENGKMVEHWGFVEEMKMMTQLGMMPEMEMPADGAPPAGGDSAAAGAKPGDTAAKAGA